MRVRRKQSSRTVWYVVTAGLTVDTFLPQTLKALVADGWSVSVLTNPSERTTGILATVPAEMRTVAFTRKIHPLNDFTSLVRVVRMMLVERPTIVVAATPKAGLIGMVAAWITGVPVRIYECWGLRFEGEKGLRRRVLLILESVAAHAATQVLANSDSLAKVFRASVRVVPAVIGKGSSHGVDTQHFNPLSGPFDPPPEYSGVAARMQQACFCIAFVGRVTRDKGIAELLESALLMSQRDSPPLVVIAGPAEDREMEHEIEALMSAGAPLMRVGMQEDTRWLYSRINVLALPTYREGFPNVILEAAAMGVPAVTTTATGAVDSVLDGETGLLVVPHDSRAFARALMLLCDDPRWANEMGNAARDRAVRHFGSETVVKSKVAFLTELWRDL